MNGHPTPTPLMSPKVDAAVSDAAVKTDRPINHPENKPVDGTPARPVDALFTGRREALQAHRCRRCGEAVDVGEFTDDVSRAEWRLTGFCAGCQTRIYQHLAELEGDE